MRSPQCRPHRGRSLPIHRSLPLQVGCPLYRRPAVAMRQPRHRRPRSHLLRLLLRDSTARPLDPSSPPLVAIGPHCVKASRAVPKSHHWAIIPHRSEPIRHQFRPPCPDGGQLRPSGHRFHLKSSSLLPSRTPRPLSGTVVRRRGCTSCVRHCHLASPQEGVFQCQTWILVCPAWSMSFLVWVIRRAGHHRLGRYFC
jgi:hypothetical protein